MIIYPYKVKLIKHFIIRKAFFAVNLAPYVNNMLIALLIKRTPFSL